MQFIILVTSQQKSGKYDNIKSANPLCLMIRRVSGHGGKMEENT